MENPSQNPQKNPTDKWNLVGLAMDLGFIIALPLVALALLGKWVDGKLDSEPWFTLAGIILAIVTTTVWLTKKIKGLIK